MVSEAMYFVKKTPPHMINSPEDDETNTCWEQASSTSS